MKKIAILLTIFIFSCQKNEIEKVNVKNELKNLRPSVKFNKTNNYEKLLKEVIKLNKANQNKTWKFNKKIEQINTEIGLAKNDSEIEKALDAGIRNSKEFKKQMYDVFIHFSLFIKDNPTLLNTKEGKQDFADEFQADLFTLRLAETKNLKTNDWCYGGCNNTFYKQQNQCDALLAFGMTASSYVFYSGGGIPASFFSMTGTYLSYVSCDYLTKEALYDCLGGCDSNQR